MAIEILVEKKTIEEKEKCAEQAISTFQTIFLTSVFITKLCTSYYQMFKLFPKCLHGSDNQSFMNNLRSIQETFELFL